MIHAIQHILGICGDSPSHASIIGLMASTDTLPWVGTIVSFVKGKIWKRKN